SGVRVGICTVFAPHTTSAIAVNEGHDPAVIEDFLNYIRELVPHEAGFEHAEGNSDSHIKALLVGPSASLPVSGGEVRLGQGQACLSRLGVEHRAAVVAAAAAAGLACIPYGAGAARVLRPGFEPPAGGGRIALLTAGTSDLAAAEEVRMLAEACGHQARLEADLGVAGLHRLLGPLAELMAWDADVLVVAAGMDGVLPGVVAGLVDRPVIGLPVATGYGAGGEGRAALLTMLQSCATGLTVVNIDNGVGAGASAVLIAARAAAARRRRPAPANPGSAPAARPG